MIVCALFSLIVCFLVADDKRTGTDQIQLLLRNAQQMLKIVEATFTDVSFVSEDTPAIAVKYPGTTGQQLAELWAVAFSALPAEAATESESYQALEALYKVQSCIKVVCVLSS